MNDSTKVKSYLLFYYALQNGQQAAGVCTRLTAKNLLDPYDFGNVALTEACRSLESEYGFSNVVLTNVIYRGEVELNGY